MMLSLRLKMIFFCLVVFAVGCTASTSGEQALTGNSNSEPRESSDYIGIDDIPDDFYIEKLELTLRDCKKILIESACLSAALPEYREFVGREHREATLRALPPTSSPIPTLKPSPTVSPTPTPNPKLIFPALAERFGTWLSHWVENNGNPPYSLNGSFSGDRPIYLPMCGVVTVHSGRGFYGFIPSASVSLASDTVVLPGDHILSGARISRRDYTLEVSPPPLLDAESVTTEYNSQLADFLDECGG